MLEHVEVAGVSIGYERRGAGPPLLLLHGLPGDSRAWWIQVDSLSDDFTVVAWDAPGCGRSSDPREPYGLPQVAQYLAAFIERLGLDRPHVLGLSWGSGVALELYRTAPHLVRSLVLASGYAGWAGSLPADDVARRLDAYLAASRSSPDDAGRSWGPGFFSPAAPAALTEALLAVVSEFHPGPLAALARSFAETDLRPVLPTIAVPTLVLHADADSRSPLDVGQALHAAIPDSQMIVLPGVGHVSNIEAPDAFDAAVRQFLRSVP